MSAAVHATANSLNIVRIIAVVDTREWVEGPDDRWYAIPGSGQTHKCCRCGRNHEVHAEVELGDRSSAVVGTGCMKQTSMETPFRRRVGRLDAAAKRLAKQRAQLEGAKRALAVREQAHKDAHALEVPPMVVSDSGYMIHPYRADIANPKATGAGKTPEHAKESCRTEFRHVMTERFAREGGVSNIRARWTSFRWRQEIEDLEVKIKKTKSKLDADKMNTR